MSKSDKKTEKTIEEKYRKKELHEHILHSPDTYIGSIEEKTCSMWVYNTNAADGEAEIVLKEITYVPGFYKICDEIYVNAADHTKRCSTCTMIKINVDQQSGKISVWNNGDGIEVAEHKEYKVMVPTLIFGMLLTSSNYDKSEKKIVGGKNGFGAKLANIYSTEFVIETVDSKRKKKFYQKFTDNMYTVHNPKISDSNEKSYTKISFVPDFKKFGIDGVTDDMFALLKKRAYDIAMSSGIKVYFNDKLITQNDFTKYIDLHFPDDSEHKKVLDVKSNDRWKICAVYDSSDKLEHQNISFVNSICTSRGGSHVDYVVNQIVGKLKDAVSKKVKNIQIKPTMIKENLLFFVDSTIVNPDFDTQTKEYLTTKPNKYGSTFTITDKFTRELLKTGVVDQIILNAEAKAEANLKKTDGKGKGAVRHEKLYNAHKAGTKEGYKCTLIVTEGESAKTFAMSGLNVVGRDYYGVFPLRGKLLNVRGESIAKISNNEEIAAIKKIMGLEQGKVYDDLKSLKYGSILVLADQDVDGSHIKGLVINFIHYFWPSLVKHEGFVRVFNTPLLKATKGKGKNKEVIEFTNPQSYEEWKEKNSTKGWNIKYYKGLGTSTPQEAQECFNGLEDKIVKFYWTKTIDTDEISAKKYNKEKKKKLEDRKDEETKESKSKSKESKESSEFIEQESDIVSEIYKPKKKDACEDAITLAFDPSKERANDRKIWLNTYDPHSYIDNAQKQVSYYDFIHKELISFSVYDTARSVPNLMDGFKPSQRKVYYGSVKKNIYKDEIKVAQLGGYISENTAYHHGEKSLEGTIVGMAQNFVGSNNINLLMPNGQFGSRLVGGKDAASARYIYTQLDPLGKKIFIEDDFPILNQQQEDGVEIEPMFYAPIIPMILINGTDGIGTGYSSAVEPCNPRDIFNNIKRILEGEKPKSMKPWFRHFTGSIEKISDGKYISRANYTVIDDDTIHISDLPIGIWTDNYKDFLDNLLVNSHAIKAEEKKSSKAASKSKSKSKAGSKTKQTKAAKGKKGKNNKNNSTAKVARANPVASAIKDYKEDCTEIRVNFTIKFHPGKLKSLLKNGKLETGLKLVKPLNITNMHLFDENGKIRKYETYGSILKHFSQVRLDLYQKRKDYLLDKWRKEIDILKWKVKFIEYVINEKIIVFKAGKTKKKDEVIARLEELKFPMFMIGAEKNPSYKYITDTGLFHLTTEEVEKLKKLLEDKKQEIATLEGKSPQQIWNEELDAFIIEYDKWEEKCNAEYQELMNKKKGSKSKRKNSKKSSPEEKNEN